MKSYPSIDRKFVFDRTLVVFDKLDGSNIRAEWNHKRGFYKFGTRTRLLDESDPMLGGAKPLILDTVGEELGRCFKNNRWERAVAFFEYWGEKSFAGTHDPDDTHCVTLIDVAPYLQGMLSPHKFINIFSGFDTPRVLHVGELSADLIDRVKDGSLEGMTYEGVVCKYEHPKLKSSEMFKIKSRAWLADLRKMCGNNDALFRRLA